MKLLPTLSHYVQAICAAGSAGALAWAQSDPAHAALAHAVAGAAGAVLTVLGLLSRAAVVPANPNPELH